MAYCPVTKEDCREDCIMNYRVKRRRMNLCLIQSALMTYIDRVEESEKVGKFTTAASGEEVKDESRAPLDPLE